MFKRQYTWSKYDAIFAKVIELRVRGATLREVGEELGVSYKTAWNYWTYIVTNPERFRIPFQIYGTELWKKFMELLNDPAIDKWNKMRALKYILRGTIPTKIEQIGETKLIIQKPWPDREKEE